MIDASGNAVLRQAYDVYIYTPATGQVHAADAVLEELGGTLQRVGFRYRPAYLALPGALSLDPAQLPLQGGEHVLQCRQSMPAFLDDYLPDAWGRRVMARIAYYRQQAKFNANSAIDSLALAGNSRIGALSIVPRGGNPAYEPGHSLQLMADAEAAAQQVDKPDLEQSDLDKAGLLYLAHSGTGVGGARPKALLSDGQKHYLAKFNRQHSDAYNNARVELACLRMAGAAGLNVGDGRVATGINGREVLLLERFDMNPDGTRKHLITFNGLLKQPATQQDIGHGFRYDLAADVIRQYVQDVQTALEQLLALMFFNRAIHNTDDHERNISLMNEAGDWAMAPAYDLVPSFTTGEFHVAGYRYQPDPPHPAEATSLGKVFGLPKPTVQRIAEQVIHAVQQWPTHAESAAASDQDSENIGRLIQGQFS